VPKYLDKKWSPTGKVEIPTEKYRTTGIPQEKAPYKLVIFRIPAEKLILL